MKNQLKNFSNEKFGNVRIIEKNNEPLFCLADVCRALYLSNVSQVKTRLKQDGVISNEVIDNLGRTQQALFITESNLYKCIFQSRRPDAELFQDWICEEVIPTIRKTGGYVASTEMFVNNYFGNLDDSSKQFLILTLDDKKKLLEENKKQQEIIQIQAPKVEHYEAITKSDKLLKIGEFAKLLSIKKLGQNNMFQLLRDKGVLNQNNQPFQYYITNGWLTVKESHKLINGKTEIYLTPLVTQKGIDYLRKKLIDWGF